MRTWSVFKSSCIKTSCDVLFETDYPTPMYSVRSNMAYHGEKSICQPGPNMDGRYAGARIISLIVGNKSQSLNLKGKTKIQSAWLVGRVG